MKKRAIIYTVDCEKVEVLAEFLYQDGWEIISAGSTADIIKARGISVTTEDALAADETEEGEFSKITNMILASGRGFESAEKRGSAREIALVCVNVRPRIYKPHEFSSLDSYDSLINMRGVSLIRAAAKNYRRVLILTDPADYQEAVIQIRTDSVSPEFRFYLAGKALNLSSAYDAAVAGAIMTQTGMAEYPNYYLLPYKKKRELRIGQSARRQACLYTVNDSDDSIDGIQKIHGPEMSCEAIRNVYAARKAVGLFSLLLKNPFSVRTSDCDENTFTTQFSPAVGSVFTVGVRNTVLTGFALGSNTAESLGGTFRCAARALDGGTVGCGAVVDESAARILADAPLRAVVAPGFTKEAVRILSGHKEICLLMSSDSASAPHEFVSTGGAMLAWPPDRELFKKWNIVTKTRPVQAQSDAMAFGMTLLLTAKSFSAVIVKGSTAAGISVAHTEAVKAVLHAFEDYQEFLRGEPDSPEENAVLVLDTALPFDERLRRIAGTGIKAVLQTGGTASDRQLIDFCNENGIVMVFTGIQHILY